jgi:CheY-like chemotaxis protein
MELRDDLKILIAEDDKINQRLAILIFDQIGLKCDMVSNGMEAFEMYRQNKYDLIFMDMQMPEMNGLDATRRIRKFENDSGTKSGVFIVALTASGFSEKNEECIEAGMNEFMEKPLRKKVLQNLIIHWLKKQI